MTEEKKGQEGTPQETVPKATTGAWWKSALNLFPRKKQEEQKVAILEEVGKKLYSFLVHKNQEFKLGINIDLEPDPDDVIRKLDNDFNMSRRELEVVDLFLAVYQVDDFERQGDHRQLYHNGS